MYIIKPIKKSKNKTYQSILLVEGYRENGKVQHKTLANLTNWPKSLIDEFEKILKGGKVTTLKDLTHTQGKSCGGLIIIFHLCKILGITSALGKCEEAIFSLLMIMGRILTPGTSRLGLVDWAKNKAIEETLGIKKFDEEQLYKSLDWLALNQENIEKKLFKFRKKEKKATKVFLYDVTSSYLEGVKNELAAFGYNRDKKKGKMQIVIGLLLDDEGYPLSVQVFDGNTQDPKTVSSQLKKLKDNFGVEQVIFVGDRGMIKQNQIDELISDEFKWNYITAITKPQIKNLLKNKIIQMDMFDEKLVEAENRNEKIRYILKRNPKRAEEIKLYRQSKIDYIDQKIKEKNKYLKEHKRSTVPVAFKDINNLITKIKFEDIIICTNTERELQYTIDNDKLAEQAKFDGCYVIKTDVSKEVASKELVHDRYKDLARVEEAFRTFKTAFEEIRPIFVRKESRTRGHVFVCMLSYLIIKYVWDLTKELGFTRQFIFESLDEIQYILYRFENETIKRLPDELLEHQQKIIDALRIKLPQTL